MEAFCTTRTYTKGWFLIPGLHVEQHKVKHPYSLCLVRLLMWMKTAIDFHMNKPEAPNRILLTEALHWEEEETRILQINHDNKPPQTLAEITLTCKVHSQCLSGLRPLLHHDALCDFI